MQSSSRNTPAVADRAHRHVPLIAAFFALALINLLCNFSMASQFGIYEDDYLSIINSFTTNWGDLIEKLKRDLIYWPQGRPLYWFSMDLSSWLAAHMGGIDQFYLFGLAITSAAAFSIYTLLIRFFTRQIALIAAAFFVLYPPDAGKQVIIHQFCFYLSTILVVMAITCYLDGRKVRAFVISILVLLTYEPYFLLLPCAVFLSLAMNRKAAWKPVVVWGALLMTILLLVFGARKLMGDGRLMSLLSNPSEAVGNGISAMFIGPATMIRVIFDRLAEGVLHGNGLQWASAVSVGAVLWMNSSLIARSPTPPYPVLQRRGWIALAAGVAIVLPYAYRFIPDYYPPNVTIGRLSALHQVSALGCSLGLAWVLAACHEAWPRLRLAVLILGGALTVCSVPFALENQETQYVRNARQQSLFWNSLVTQIGDLKEGMPIIVDFDSCLAAYDELGTEGFNPYWLINYPVLTLPYLVSLPTEWKQTPRIFAYSKSTPQWAHDNDLAIQSSIFSTAADPVILRNDGFIFLEWQTGRLVRSTKAIGTGSISVTPKTPGADYNTSFPLTSLGRSLLQPDKRFWHPLSPSYAYPNR